MELGPRDRLSQAFWHELQKGRTLATPQGPAVHLYLRHLGAKKIHERLPLIAEAAKTFAGVDAAKEPIPVCPAVHYTMGGILTNVRCETPLAGLYAAGECASVGIHGANRLGSNSLVEIVVFGKVAGEEAAQYAASHKNSFTGTEKLAETSAAQMLSMLKVEKGERLAVLRDEMRDTMEAGVGIYRKADALRAACDKLAELRARYRRGVRLDDRSRAFNTEWLTAIELGFMLDVAQAMAHSALERRESRGAHMRLDGFEARDDANYLKHTLATHAGDDSPRISYGPVTITRSKPEARVYGGAGKQAVLT
jgi:fumarate reductase flavoprotein subunit